MIFGYARVSTKKQNLDMQLDELNRYGCEEIVTEKKVEQKRTEKSFNYYLANFAKVIHWLFTS